VKVRLTILLIGALMLALEVFGQVYTPEELEALKTYISSQEVVRVRWSNAPGYGHQTSTVEMMKRLRELGFKGKFQIIYSRLNPGKVGFDPEKTKILLPHFNIEDSSGFQVFPDGTELIEVKTLNEKIAEGQMKRVLIGVTGGEDIPHNFLHTEFYLKAQPFAWPKPEILEGTGFRPQKYRLSDDVSQMIIRQSIPEPEDVGEFLDKELKVSPELKAKAKGLKTLYSKTDEFEILPIYDSRKNEGRIAKMAIASMNAQSTKRANPLAKPVVIPILGRLPSNFELEHENIIIAKVTDDLKVHLADLKPGQVLILEVGPLPREVFHYVLTHSSLPPLIEGKNAINLMVNAGKPFLPFDDITALPDKVVHTELRKCCPRAYSLMMKAKSTFDPNVWRYQIPDLTDFIAEAGSPKSKIVSGFEKVSKTLTGQDKYTASLIELKRVIDQRAAQVPIEDVTLSRPKPPPKMPLFKCFRKVIGEASN